MAISITKEEENLLQDLKKEFKSASEEKKELKEDEKKLLKGMVDRIGLLALTELLLKDELEKQQQQSAEKSDKLHPAKEAWFLAIMKLVRQVVQGFEAQHSRLDNLLGGSEDKIPQLKQHAHPTTMVGVVAKNMPATIVNYRFNPDTTITEKGFEPNKIEFSAKDALTNQPIEQSQENKIFDEIKNIEKKTFDKFLDSEGYKKNENGFIMDKAGARLDDTGLTKLKDDFNANRTETLNATANESKATGYSMKFNFNPPVQKEIKKEEEQAVSEVAKKIISSNFGM